MVAGGFKEQVGAVIGEHLQVDRCDPRGRNVNVTY